jgi:hypothetical protein
MQMVVTGRSGVQQRRRNRPWHAAAGEGNGDVGEAKEAFGVDSSHGDVLDDEAELLAVAAWLGAVWVGGAPSWLRPSRAR